MIDDDYLTAFTPENHLTLFATAVCRARAALQRARKAGRSFLGPGEAHDILAAYHISFAQTREAADVEAAVACAEQFSTPVALKILSRRHCAPFSYSASPKAWRKGIAVELETPNQVRRAAQRLQEHMAQLYPGEKPLGFLVQEMRRGPGSVLLNMGITRDPVFGPLILFGEGGSIVKTLADRQVSLPPLNMGLAKELMGRSSVAAFLDDVNEKASEHRLQIRKILVALSQIAMDFPEITGLEINPFLIRGKTMLALDAVISLGSPMAAAIKGYPEGLSEMAVLKSGRQVELRPIRPEDEPAHRIFADGLSKEAIRFRFFTSISRLSHKQLAHLTQIDYHREMAFIATAPNDEGQPETLGVVRVWTDPDKFTSEFAVIIRGDLYGQGLGNKLLKKIIHYCRDQGVILLTGSILPENRPMQGLAKHLGFSLKLNVREQVVEANLQLCRPKDEWQKQRLADILGDPTAEG